MLLRFKVEVKLPVDVHRDSTLTFAVVQRGLPGPFFVELPPLAAGAFRVGKDPGVGIVGSDGGLGVIKRLGLAFDGVVLTGPARLARVDQFPGLKRCARG